ncbi:MAG: sodium:solute symporter [Clostridiales bacterium]|nr:sodium:solute symporter [Clostridiales bacterium]
MLLKVSLLVVFFAVTIIVGLYFRKRNTSINSYVLGGRSIGPWLTAFAYGTSYFSAVVFVGYAGQFGWRFGISAVWIGLGNAFIGSLLAWVVLARRTRIMSRHLNSATMPDFFGARFGSGKLKIGASLITFVFLVPYTASLYNGLSRLFAMAFGVDFVYCIIAMAILTAIYVIAGGYTATAVNDFIQGLIMLAGIVAVVAAVLNANGGFEQSLAALARVSDAGAPEASLRGAPGVFASFFGPEPLNLLGVVLLTSVGTWGLPQMVQKFYSIRSEKNINTGTVVSTVFAIVISGGCYFLGGFGRLFSDGIDVAANGYDSIIPTMLSNFPDLLIGIVIVLVFSASISTLSALVMTSASTFALDFLKGNIVKSASEKTQLAIIRLLVAAFILVSAIIAIVQSRSSITFIAQFMGISWGALAGAFLAPFLYGLYWKRVTAAAVWANFAFASVFMVLNIAAKSYFPAMLQSPINAGAFAMLAGMAIVPLVSALTPAPDKKRVDGCFSCYDAAVAVRARESLGIAEDGAAAKQANAVKQTAAVAKQGSTVGEMAPKQGAAKRGSRSRQQRRKG